MDCLKSFIFNISAGVGVGAGVELDFWGVAPQNYWAYQTDNKISTFNFQGFKNINIHAIDAVGDVTPVINSLPVIVNDWSFTFEISGTNQLSPGFISAPNFFNITNQATNPVVYLSKYKNKIDFLSPILSCQNIKITQLKASGIGADSLSAITLQWDLSLVIYYSFEGEIT